MMRGGFLQTSQPFTAACMGPGAGNLGGTVVAHGTPQQVANVRDSATAPFLKKAIAGKK